MSNMHGRGYCHIPKRRPAPTCLGADLTFFRAVVLKSLLFLTRRSCTFCTEYDVVACTEDWLKGGRKGVRARWRARGEWERTAGGRRGGSRRQTESSMVRSLGMESPVLFRSAKRFVSAACVVKWEGEVSWGRRA